MDRAGAGSKRLAFLSVNKRMDKLNGKERRTMLPTKEEKSGLDIEHLNIVLPECGL